MSERHFIEQESTFKNDMMSILECAAKLIFSCECCEFGQVY